MTRIALALLLVLGAGLGLVSARDAAGRSPCGSGRRNWPRR
ncbi:hypothetical protein A6302_04553 [Methylobrevis pamukkalensis]|uniref:Uncharacterized protein n=2 Tax=Methylobrevis pamukkalensis TaxID=1439726 RepID=A0A1E3GMY5_9HYPH|nr:hypothetical protein A6302_04553 [Methylobrevis pamukkalensis]